MKKLFTLALIGVFSTFLTSCSNTAGEQIQEPINQTYQNVSASKRTMSDEQLIENAISLVKNNTEQKGSFSSRRLLDSLIIIEPEEPTNPEPPIYEENGIICHTPYNQNSGSACVLNSSGNLVRVTWSLEMTDIGPGGSGGNGQTPIEPRKVYVGTVVRTCNC